MNSSDLDAAAYAKKYTEDLLTFFGLNTAVDVTDEEVIQISVPSTHLNGFLIGAQAETLRAMQGLISAALQGQNFDKTRVNLDIADYKKQRQDRLAKQTEEWIGEIKTSGQEMHLKPMNPADRRIVHQVAAEHDVTTESVGLGLERHIVIKPAS